MSQTKIWVPAIPCPHRRPVLIGEDLTGFWTGRRSDELHSHTNAPLAHVLHTDEFTVDPLLISDTDPHTLRFLRDEEHSILGKILPRTGRRFLGEPDLNRLRHRVAIRYPAFLLINLIVSTIHTGLLRHPFSSASRRSGLDPTRVSGHSIFL